jgi:hypothetical protein
MSHLNHAEFPPRRRALELAHYCDEVTDNFRIIDMIV